MRENRPYGSEGGKITNLPDPYQVKFAGLWQERGTSRNSRQIPDGNWLARILPTPRLRQASVHVLRSCGAAKEDCGP